MSGLSVKELCERIDALNLASKEAERARSDRDAWAVVIARRWVSSVRAGGEREPQTIHDDFAMVAFEAAERRTADADARLRQALDAMQPDVGAPAEATP